jgi:hypothetical protein
MDVMTEYMKQSSAQTALLAGDVEKLLSEGAGMIRSQTLNVDTGVDPDHITVTSKESLKRSPKSHPPTFSHTSTMSPMSSTSLESGGDMPRHAIVINFRRLVSVKLFFAILHERIKSTVFGALTLVAADSTRQGAYTCVFLILVFMVYGIHESLFDGLDIEDVKSLVPLIRSKGNKDREQNPNTLLKSISTPSPAYWCVYLVHCAVGAASGLGWLVLWYSWHHTLVEATVEVSEPVHHWLEVLSRTMVFDDDDAGVLAMQLLILDIMFVIELLFEYVLSRETASFMPLGPNNSVWDPRKHGVPSRFWLLGLPSMWFTSKESLDKLKDYVGQAQKPSADSVGIYPQELAYYALLGIKECEELSFALKESRLFNANTNIVQGDKLGIDLCFFDDRDQHFKDGERCPHPGELQYFQPQRPDASAEESGRSSRLASWGAVPSAHSSVFV